MKPGEEAPFEEGVSSPGPSFPEAFDWRGGCTAGVPSSVEPAGVWRGKVGRGGQDFGCLVAVQKKEENGLIQ